MRWVKKYREGRRGSVESGSIEEKNKIRGQISVSVLGLCIFRSSVIGSEHSGRKKKYGVSCKRFYV
jgi:hypothetical protein